MGCDFLVDEAGRAWLLEANCPPSQDTATVRQLPLNPRTLSTAARLLDSVLFCSLFCSVLFGSVQGGAKWLCALC